jgi:hypothetical protein
MLLQLPVLLYFVVLSTTKNFLWSLLEWVVLTIVIAACIWKHDFGTWKFWQ